LRMCNCFDRLRHVTDRQTATALQTHLCFMMHLTMLMCCRARSVTIDVNRTDIFGLCSVVDQVLITLLTDQTYSY